MDNRRYSARADIGVSTPSRREGVSVPALDRAIELTRLNWEVVAFAAIVILAAVLRLWELGPRAMHHDESIHAYFSNHFLKSGDYTQGGTFEGGYDPTYHGPFLYHITGLGYFLFGVTEATSRLMPAFFGIVLVGLCWLLRPFIGRWGAIIAALLVTISPSITYYSRSLRHDIFALTGLMLLFISILWFMRTHQSKWVYLGALGLGIAYTSHELTFLVVFMFVLFLGLAAFLFPVFADRVSYNDPRSVPDDVNPVRAAWAALIKQKWTLVGGILVFVAIYAAMFTSLFTKPLLLPSGIVRGLEYWLGQHREARGNQPVFYYMLIMILEEPLILLAGLGTIGYALSRWIRGRADKLAEGDEVDALPTDLQSPAPDPRVDPYGVALPSIEGLRGFTIAFLIFWSLGAFVAFSLAGERMPWLTMQIALPFTLLASAGLGRLLGRMEWRQVLRGGGVFLGISVILFIVVAFVLMAWLNPQGGVPQPVGTNVELQKGMRSVLLFLFAAGFLGLSGWLAYKLMPLRALKVVGLTFAVILAGYTARSMFLSSFQYSDTPVTMLVYTQSAPDTAIVADLVTRLSRDETVISSRGATDVTGGRGLEIAIDETDAITWPFNWYFRDMRNYRSFKQGAWTSLAAGSQQNIVAPNVAVMIVSTETENAPAFQEFIKDKYTTQRYVLNWWFPETAYKKQVPSVNPDTGQSEIKEVGDIGTAWSWLTSNGLKYILYRNPSIPLGSRDFYLHVRSDLAPKAGLGSFTGVTTQQPINNPPQQPVTDATYGMFDLRPAGIERGQFNLPRGIARDGAGNFYVVDTVNMRVQKFDPQGKFLAIIGNGRGNGDGQFNPLSFEGKDSEGTGPGGIAVDSQGNIYVADTWNHRIQKFGPAGNFIMRWGEFIDLGSADAASDAAKNSKFYGPRGVAIGPGDTVYVSDTGNKRISIFDKDGKFVREISSGLSPERRQQNYVFNLPGEMNEPIGVTVDGTGNVYVADTENKRIQKFDPAGKNVGTWPVPGDNWSPGPYREPFLALDAQGANLYATAPTGKKVLKYNTADGKLLGEKATEAVITLKLPTGITVGADGTLYVVETTSHGVVNLGKMP